MTYIQDNIIKNGDGTVRNPQNGELHVKKGGEGGNHKSQVHVTKKINIRSDSTLRPYFFSVECVVRGVGEGSREARICVQSTRA